MSVARTGDRGLVEVFGLDMATDIVSAVGIDDALTLLDPDQLDPDQLDRSARAFAAMTGDEMRQQFNASEDLVRACREFQFSHGY